MKFSVQLEKVADVKGADNIYKLILFILWILIRWNKYGNK